MSLQIYPGFVGGTNATRSSASDIEKTINLYLETGTGTPKTQQSLIGSPGITPYLALTGGRGRGLFAQDDFAWAVCGTYVYQLYPNATARLIGIMASNDEPVSWMFNGRAGNQMAVASGGLLYVQDLASGVFGTVPDANALGPVSSIAFLGGYGVLLNVTNGTFTTSEPEDFTTWDAGEVELVQAASNNLVRILANRLDLWIFGTVTTTVWALTGDPNIRLAEIPGALLEYGAYGASPAILEGSPIWAGRSSRGFGQVLRANGYSPVVVSIPAVDRVLQSSPSLDGCIGWTYQEEGHPFYCVDVPNAPTQWVYDARENSWHERARLDPLTGLTQLPRSLFHASAWGQHLVQDRLTGWVYTSSLNTTIDTVPA